VWRPSTFWCYDVRQQALIIAGSLASCFTSLWGGFLLFKNYKLGQQRLTRLDVDLTRVTRPFRVLATALLADKCIKLHKLKDPITYSTLWNNLPFDEDQDKDIGDMIDDRILKLVSELEKQDTRLDFKHIVDVIRSSQVSHQQPSNTQTSGAQLRRRHSAGGSVGTPSDPGASSSITRDPSHPPPAVVITQDPPDCALASSHSDVTVEPANAATPASPLNDVGIQPQRERSRPPLVGSRAERSRPPPQSASGEPHLSTAPSFPSPQSTAVPLNSLASVPLPPRPRSKSRGRAPAPSPSTANSDSGHQTPAAAAAANASSLLAARRFQQHDGERSKKLSSVKPKDGPPPLSATHRLRVMGAEIGEC
jgi:hypothetical protein